MEDVVVSSRRRDGNVQQAQMGKIDLSMTQVKAVPVLLGEVDLLKTLQLMPGVYAMPAKAIRACMCVVAGPIRTSSCSTMPSCTIQGTCLVSFPSSMPMPSRISRSSKAACRPSMVVLEPSGNYSLQEQFRSLLAVRRERPDVFHAPHYVLPPLVPVRVGGDDSRLHPPDVSASTSPTAWPTPMRGR